jgi:hypothetical protein
MVPDPLLQLALRNPWVDIPDIIYQPLVFANIGPVKITVVWWNPGRDQEDNSS